MCKFEPSILKNKKFQNFDPFGGGDPKRDPDTKIFQQVWYQGIKIYILCKFEAAIFKNKKSKIFTLLGAEAKKGPIKI